MDGSHQRLPTIEDQKHDATTEHGAVQLGGESTEHGKPKDRQQDEADVSDCAHEGRQPEVLPLKTHAQ